MAFDWQDILGSGIVLMAVGYLLHRGWKTFRGKSASGCGSCGTCETPSQKQVVNLTIIRDSRKSSSSL